MGMAPAEFDKIVEDIREGANKTMLGKRAEYSPHEGDVLQNFRQIAAFEGRTPAEVCISYLLKHLQSLLEATQTDSISWVVTKEDGSEGTKQRLHDGRNYIYFLAACLEEQSRYNKPRQR